MPVSSMNAYVHLTGGSRTRGQRLNSALTARTISIYTSGRRPGPGTPGWELKTEFPANRRGVQRNAGGPRSAHRLSFAPARAAVDAAACHGLPAMGLALGAALPAASAVYAPPGERSQSQPRCKRASVCLVWPGRTLRPGAHARLGRGTAASGRAGRPLRPISIGWALDRPEWSSKRTKARSA